MYNCTKCPYIIYPFKAVIVWRKSCNCSQCKLKVSPTDEPNQLTVETINLILCIESQIHIHEYLTPHTHTHTHTFGTPLVRCLQRPSWPILCIVGKKKNGDFELTSGNYFNGKILYFLFFVFNLTNLPDRRGEIWSFEKDFLLLLLLLLFFFFLIRSFEKDY